MNETKTPTQPPTTTRHLVDDNRWSGTDLAIACFTGFATDWLIYFLLRVQNTKVLIGYALPVVLCAALGGVVLGGLNAARRGERGARASWFLLLCTLAFCCGAVFHQGVPSYYPRFPDLPPAQPDPLWPYPIALFISVIASFAPFALLAERYVRVLRRSARPALLSASHLVGFCLGGLSAWASIGWLGGYVGLLIGATLALCCLPQRGLRRLSLVAMACLFVWSFLRPPLPFLWNLQDGEVIESTWSNYNKLDFVAFPGIEGDKDCVASVYNDTLMYYTCPHGHEDHYQRIQFWKAILPERKRLLIVGSSGGMAMLSALDYDPELERIVGVELDEVVVNRFENSFSAYNGDVFKRPIVEVHAAEGRRMMHQFAEDKERFDLVYLDGVDQRIYSFWQSGVPIENYLFTREGLGLAIDDLLTDNGVVLLDIGGVDPDGVNYYLDSMPEGTHATLAWYAVSSYPMVGLPLFLIVMSKNRAAVDQVAAGFRAIPSIETVPNPLSHQGPAATDDRPFPPRPDALEWPLLLLILVLIGGLPLWRRAQTQLASATPAIKAKPGALFSAGLLLLGLSGGLVQCVLVSRLARSFEGPSLGAAMIIALFLVGGAFAGVWAWFIGPHRSGRGLVFGGLALVAGATLYAAGLTGGDVPTVALTIGLALLAGLGSSAIWPLLVERIPRERIGAVFALESLGYLLGVAGCQVVLLFLGYQATGLLAILALCLATGLLLRWTRPALDLAGSA